MLNVQTREFKNVVVTEEQREALATEMYGVLTGYDWSATKEACRAIVDKWAEDKAPLIAVLQNHPNWVPDKFQIVFNKSFNRVTDRAAIDRYLSWLNNFFRGNCLVERKIDGHDMLWWLEQYKITDDRIDWINYRNLSLNRYEEESNKKLEMFEKALNWFMDNHSAKVDKEGADLMNELYPDVIRAKEGMKTSRLMHKICVGVYHLDEIWEERTRYRDVNGIVKSYQEKYRPFNSQFCKYADAINPIEYKLHTIISVNPVDYLTMSIGNSWASCHTIDLHHDGDNYNGCYCGGTLSYLLDGTSAVVYTVKNDYSGRDFELEEKVNRQMIHYHDGIMIQGRLYPQDCDYGCNDQYKVWREIEEAVFSEALGMPNLWKYKKADNMNQYVRSEGVHYRDYNCYDTCGSCRISVDTGIFRGDDEDPNGDYERMTIGHTGLDIYYAGEEVSCEDTLTDYGRPGDEGYVRCAECGERICRDEAYCIDGEYYCSDCVQYCNYYDEYFTTRDTGFTYVNGYGSVCDEALEILRKEGKVKFDNFYGEYYWLERYPGNYDIRGNWHCNNVLNRYFVIPEGHSEYVFKRECIQYKGKWYAENDCMTCKECGQIFPKMFDNDRHICLDCIADEYKKTA